LSENEALALAESLPPPTFDADRRLRKLDLLEHEGS
jgi:tRNA (guanine-N7-)-methyltransferase